MQESSPFLSQEEEVELARSNKKVKDVHHANFNENQGHFLGAPFVGNEQVPLKFSFKEKLLGDIPGAYKQAFDFTDQMEAEPEKDRVISVLREGFAVVTLSSAVKQCIRAPWLKSLIVKVYGRNVGFSFLQSKIMALWRPSGKVDCVDLGKEFFLIRFSMKADYNAVLENGLWFIGKHFLSIRPWEPNFRPSTVSVSSIAVWVRLNELPIEYYEVEVLKEIGKSIGNVLRINTHTALELRRRYARLCVQVDVGKPLIMTIIIGNIEQMVVYEGIQKLCFCSGWIGHRKEACPYAIWRTRQTGSMEAEGSKTVVEVPRDQHDPTHAEVYLAGPEEGQEEWEQWEQIPKEDWYY